jgi:erythronate-4-phosphate dehydrogenase
MRSVVVENLTGGAAAFGRHGEVLVVPDAALAPEHVRGADVVAARSVVPLNAALLHHASPRFVGTATAGVDHVDQAYLRARGIAFAHAPGANARSVAEYWAAALLHVARHRGFDLAGRTVGVIGVGNVGRRVCRVARALGLDVLGCDPPLRRRTGSTWYRPLEELLARADVLTLHVPLTPDGPDPTHHLVDEQFLAQVRRGVLLCNTSRGGVHDSVALGEALADGTVGAAILDVWEDEPDLDPALVAAASVATPHIAGHSLDDKYAGTAMIYRAACRALGLSSRWTPADSRPPPAVPELTLPCAGRSALAVATETVHTLYPIQADDAALRALLPGPAAARANGFHAQRSGYWPRRTFALTTVHLPDGTRAHRDTLAGLGFTVAPGAT